MTAEKFGKQCCYCQGITFDKRGDLWACRDCQAEFTTPELIACKVSLAPGSNKLFPDDVAKLFFPEVSTYSWGDAVDIVSNHRLDPDCKEEMTFYRTIAPAIRALQSPYQYDKRSSTLNDVRAALKVVLSVKCSDARRLAMLKRVYGVLETLGRAHSQPKFLSYYSGDKPGRETRRFKNWDDTKVIRSSFLEDAALCLEKLHNEHQNDWYLLEAQRLYLICLQHYFDRYSGRFRHFTISIGHYKSLQNRIRKLNKRRLKFDKTVDLLEVPTLDFKTKIWPHINSYDNSTFASLIFLVLLTTIFGAFYYYYTYLQ